MECHSVKQITFLSRPLLKLCLVRLKKMEMSFMKNVLIREQAEREREYLYRLLNTRKEEHNSPNINLKLFKFKYFLFTNEM